MSSTIISSSFVVFHAWHNDTAHLATLLRRLYTVSLYCHNNKSYHEWKHKSADPRLYTMQSPPWSSDYVYVDYVQIKLVEITTNKMQVAAAAAEEWRGVAHHGFNVSHMHCWTIGTPKLGILLSFG